MGQNDPHGAPCDIGRRTNARLRLSLPGTLALLTETARGQLLDLSCTGTRFQCADQRCAMLPARGSAIVQCAGIDMFADIVWSNSGMCGLRFETPLPRQRLLDIRTYADSYSADVLEQHRRDVQDWVKGRARHL